jgi:hypothetical protein
MKTALACAAMIVGVFSLGGAANAAPVYLDCKVTGQTNITEVFGMWFDGTNTPTSVKLQGTDYAVIGGTVTPEAVGVRMTGFNNVRIEIAINRMNKSAILHFLNGYEDTEDSPYTGSCNVSDQPPKPAF